MFSLKKIVVVGVYIFMPMSFLVMSAHGNQKHKAKDTIRMEIRTVPPIHHPHVKETNFVTLHPLVVHFPIVLLILSFFLQLTRVLFRQAQWDSLILYILMAGVVTAYLAGEVFHPHTEGLTPLAADILERHELYSSLTLIFSLIAILTKVTGIYLIRKRQKLFEIITTLILLFSATTVSIAGHWGAYLTHVEGVGPQGNYLQTEK